MAAVVLVFATAAAAHPAGWFDPADFESAVPSETALADAPDSSWLGSALVLSDAPTPPPSPLPLCGPLDPPLIVYNRVPKTGSMTLLKLLMRFQESTRLFTYVHLQTVEQQPAAAIHERLEWLAGRGGGRTVYESHAMFVGGIEGGGVYINVVRDPVERLASLYHYTRWSPLRSAEQRAAAVARFGNATMDECVARPRGEWAQCGVTPAMLRWFCGGGNRCPADPAEQLRLAKAQASAHFAVVGTTARLADVVRVLERRFPRYFRGLGARARGLRHHNSHGHADPAPETVARLRKATRHEREFYEWVDGRLSAQMECMGLSLSLSGG